MERNIFETEDFPKIVAETIKGNLKIKGWDRNSFRVDSDIEDSTEIEQSGNTFTLNSNSNCLLRVPFESEILIENVHGDLVVKSIENHLNVENVKGQVILKSVGSTAVENVNGNFTSKQIEGDLVIETAKGNVLIREIEGSVTLEDGEGNFNFAGFSQKLDIHTKGNATLSLAPEFDGVYSIEAGGNIKCQLETTLKAKADLNSHSKVIRIKTDEQNEIINEDQYELNPNENDFQLNLEAKGKIDYVDLGRNPQGDKSINLDQLIDININEGKLNALADDITQQVTDSIGVTIGSINEQINVITASLGNNKASANKARQKLKNKKVELRHLAKAQRDIAHSARRSAQRARKDVHKKRIIKHRSMKTENRATDPVSDEERQMILQMLQDKKIDINQAEILLSAIEGKELISSQEKTENATENIDIDITDLENLEDLEELADLTDISETVDIDGSLEIEVEVKDIDED